MISYAAQLGLRSQALRVHRECSRVYREMNPAAAAGQIPRLRVDHYYPWLAVDDLPVEESTSRALAVGNVLLSDAAHCVLRALRAGGVRAAEAEAVARRELTGHALDCFDGLLGADADFLAGRDQFLDEQRAALSTELLLIAGGRLLSDAEAEVHATRKGAHLKITLLALGRLSGQTEKARILMLAQDHLSAALDLYQAFVNWRLELSQFPANRVLMMLRSSGCDLADEGELRRVIYDSGFSDQVFERIILACCHASSGNYESRPFRQIIRWLVERVQRLQADLGSLRRGDGRR